jgi:hypothetical protein
MRIKGETSRWNGMEMSSRRFSCAPTDDVWQDRDDNVVLLLAGSKVAASFHGAVADGFHFEVAEQSLWKNKGHINIRFD